MSSYEEHIGDVLILARKSSRTDIVIPFTDRKELVDALYELGESYALGDDEPHNKAIDLLYQRWKSEKVDIVIMNNHDRWAHRHFRRLAKEHGIEKLIIFERIT